MSSNNIMSISDMIHLSFGDSKENVVNFKLIQAVLYLLASQLRVLERRVEVKVGIFDPDATAASSNLSVTEVKINATVAKKRRKTNQETTQKTTLIKAASSTVKEDGESSDTSSVPSNKGFLQTPHAEMLREKELRVINQRADSHEEPDIEPVPMALVPSTEIKNEKILIIERKQSEVGTMKRGGRSQEVMAKLSIVTKEEFRKLQDDLNELREQYTDTLKFPENAELMNQLRKGASLTDAMSALKLSARLEAAERSVEVLSGIVTEICKDKGFAFESDEIVSSTKSGTKNKTAKGAATTKTFKGKAADAGEESEHIKQELAKEEDEEQNLVDQGVSVVFRPKKMSIYSLEDDEYVTYGELNLAMKNLEQQIMKTVYLQNKHSEEASKKALHTSLKLEEQLDEALALASRMDELHEMVSKYSSRITDIDTGISAQMTSYQDQLTQMQFDLESTIESVAEAIASSGADPELIKELRLKFKSLHQNLDVSLADQKEIHQVLQSLALDIEELWKEIESLRATKCDHEELNDALHDKVDTSAINGMIAEDYFEACMDDFTNKMLSIYKKCDAHEQQWQKAINDFATQLNTKADFSQMKDLRDSIRFHLESLKDITKSLAITSGTEQAGAVSRCLIRDTDCLSCRRPAVLNPEGSAIPKLSAFGRPPTIGAEAMTEGGDGVCYPGQPIPHLLDPRAKFCRRYCGGHVTGERHPLMKAVTKHLRREESRQINADGKSYVVHDSLMKPCAPCNKLLEMAEKPPAQGKRRVSSKSKETSLNPWSGEFASKTGEISVSNTIPMYEDDDD